MANQEQRARESIRRLTELKAKCFCERYTCEHWQEKAVKIVLETCWPDGDTCHHFDHLQRFGHGHKGVFSPDCAECAHGGELVRKQSQIRERMKRMLRKALPDFEFNKYPVLVLRPHQREDDRPAWSVGATRKSDGLLFDVYSQETMSDVIFWGLVVHAVDVGDRYVWVGANVPELIL